MTRTRRPIEVPILWLQTSTIASPWEELLVGSQRGETRIRVGRDPDFKDTDFGINFDHQGRFIEIDTWQALFVMPVANNRIRIYSKREQEVDKL